MAFNPVGRGSRADINVTPLIDVVLVLLIVFMMLVPKLLNSMAVELPVPVAEGMAEAPDRDQLVLVISEEGVLAINGETVPAGALVEKVRVLMQGRSKRLMFFAPADGASYEAVVGVMDTCRGAGVQTIGIVTQR